MSLTPRAELLQSATPPGEIVEVAGREVFVERSGSGPPLLLVHGFGGSTWTWREVAPRLAERYSVMAVDLVGFGLTERPEEPAAYTREAQVAMLSGLLEAVGWRSAHVMAHSYGGAVAMAMATQEPDRVRSLVLVDSAPPWYPVDRRRGIARYRPLIAAYLRAFALRESNVRRALRRIYAEDERVTDELVSAYLERLRSEGIVRAYRGLTMPRSDRPEIPVVLFEEIHQPTLIVWGSDDTVVRPESGWDVVDRFQDGRMVEIPQCGHSPQEECPGDLLDVVLPFLEAGEPGEPSSAGREAQVASFDGEGGSSS